MSASQLADQPLAAAACGVGKCRVDDLHQLLVAGRKADRHGKTIPQLRTAELRKLSEGDAKDLEPFEELEKQMPHRLKSVRDDNKMKDLLRRS